MPLITKHLLRSDPLAFSGTLYLPALTGLPPGLCATHCRRGEAGGTSAESNSMDLSFQGMGWFNRGAARENLTQARSLFERALALDPGNVDAELNIAGVDAVMAAHLYDRRPGRASRDG